MLHFLEGPSLGHITEEGKRKKAQQLAGTKPMTSLSQGVRSATVLQLLQPQFLYTDLSISLQASISRGPAVSFVIGSRSRIR